MALFSSHGQYVIYSILYATGKPKKAQRTLLDKANDLIVATPKSVLLNAELNSLYVQRSQRSLYSAPLNHFFGPSSH